MSLPPALTDEISSINAIFSPGTLSLSLSGYSPSSAFIPIDLTIPDTSLTLRLHFPRDYPENKPSVVEVVHVGAESVGKGYGAKVLSLAREELDQSWTEGIECLYDLIERIFAANLPLQHEELEPTPIAEAIGANDLEHADSASTTTPSFPPPEWVTGEPYTEKKSLFVARACSVASPSHAKACITHLLASDKRVAKATHNISAYRIRAYPAGSSDSDSSGKPPAREVCYQDCDSDGETAAGGRMLHLLQVMDVWGVVVVVSRWYGGVKLGPGRFAVINQQARAVLAKGGWVREREKGKG
jgi:hypothetical protein